MDKRISTYLLDKYLKGECSFAEEAQVVEWYNSFNDNADRISSVSEAEKQEIKERIYTAISANTQGLTGKSGGNGKFRYIYYTIGTVAAMLLIYAGFHFMQAPAVKSNQPAASMIAISNNTHTLLEQTLSDGTQVWLSPGAKIKYNKVFTGNTREVTMTGESFFEVAKNPAKPFIIYSGKIITKVWGTSFRVRDNAGSAFADVAVVTGKVSVKLAAPDKRQASVNEVMIYPNQRVTYVNGQKGLKTDKKTKSDDLKIWQKVNLSFDNIALSQVVTTLNKNFGVNISINDNDIKTFTLNADFNGLNLPQIMEILHKTLNVTYEIAGTDITLKKS